ncbi:hypothetical protein [Maritalea porphyrae]|uniref:hypothetical protein n=1 Tax=Maritalea porphyrae TaxID=880732 RepID=UPI0022AF16E9|nr:hypothetical protein [Maritalea porphyrae]MCZ4270771.1 hypothetical protein [Maritalea porphyrae]
MSFIQRYNRKDFVKLSNGKAMIEVEVFTGGKFKTHFGVVHHPEPKTVWVGSYVFHYQQIRKFKEIGNGVE